MREYLCWLSEKITTAIKAGISKAPQHCEWEKHTYGREYLSCPNRLHLLLPALHTERTEVRGRCSRCGPLPAKNVNCFYWFLQRLTRIVRRSENMTMYSTCIWIFKLLKPVTFKKKGIIKYIMMSLCFFRSVYLYTCLRIISLKHVFFSACLCFSRPAWLL